MSAQKILQQQYPMHCHINSLDFSAENLPLMCCLISSAAMGDSTPVALHPDRTMIVIRSASDIMK
jgi:hypothetical protein